MPINKFSKYTACNSRDLQKITGWVYNTDARDKGKDLFTISIRFVTSNFHITIHILNLTFNCVLLKQPNVYSTEYF